MSAEWAYEPDRRRIRTPSMASTSSQLSCNSNEPFASTHTHDRRRGRLNGELLNAVFSSDFKKVERMLQEGHRPDPDAYCSDCKASALHIAVLRGDMRIINLLLNAGASTNVRDSQGRLPIHYAAWEDDIGVLMILLKANPQLIDATAAISSFVWKPEYSCGWEHDHQQVSALISMILTHDGSTALHIAAMHGKQAVVEYLIAQGAKVDVTDSKGRSPLDVAGLRSCKSEPRTLLASSTCTPDSLIMPTTFFHQPSKPSSPGVTVTDNMVPTPYSATPFIMPIGMEGVDTKTIGNAIHNIANMLVNKGAKLIKKEHDSVSAETSALHSAIMNDDHDTFNRFIELGASLTMFDEDGDTPLHLAVRMKKRDYLEVIVHHLDPHNIDMKNKKGLTALQLAVGMEWLEGVAYLLESNANIKEKDDHKGETVFHIAARTGNLKMIKGLISVIDAPKVINEKDNEGFTPLFRAIKESYLPIVEELIEVAKVNVKVHLKDGINVVQFTVLHSNSSILAYLVKVKDCNKLLNEISPSDAGGETALHLAADMGQETFVKILLDAGANPNLFTTDDPKGRATALHLAARKGFRRTIEVILEHDITSLNLEDKYKWKPLHVASAFGHGKSAMTMMRFGADPSDTVPFHGSTKTAFDLMVTNVPRCGELLDGLLDSYIETPDDFRHRNNPSCAIHLNFEILLSSNDTNGRQLTFLNSLVNTNDESIKEILLHPLIEIFLHMKWEKLWKFFAILLFIYLVHITALTAYCVVIFIEHYNMTWGKNILQFTFLSSLVPIILAEALQFLRLEKRYWNDHESWIKWMMISTSGTVGYVSGFHENADWIRHFASFAILTSWIELLFLVSRFRYWGLDVLMFEKVIENVATVLSKFVFLFLGFMFALMIHFEGEQPFSGFWKSLCQVVIMVVELDYGGAFDNETTSISSFVGRLIYVGYMIFVALAMTNLTVGLAVSDIAALEKQGRVERLIKRTSFLSFLETLVYDERLVCCVPKRGVERKSFRSVEPFLTIFPNKPGVLPYRLKAELLLKVHPLDKTENLSTAHFDERIATIYTKVEKMNKDVERLLKSARVNQ